MSCNLLLADPHDPVAPVRVVPLELQLLQTSPGGRSIAVTFQPNRTDDLHTSARDAAELAYRILFREGIVRSQSVVRIRLPGAPANVVGNSAGLPFALAVLLKAYEQAGQGRTFPTIAATGALDPDGTVHAVEHLPAKLSAARELSAASATVFFPAANGADLTAVQVSPGIDLIPIGHLDEALERLGIVLERVYLRNPYRGLEPFDYEHRAIFFGRERETTELLEQLLRREKAGMPGALVEGPSGSGKSSFLRAGVLPALVNPRDQPPAVRDALASRPVTCEARYSIWRPGLMPAAVDEPLVVHSIGECWSVFPELSTALRTKGLGTLPQLAQLWRQHWPQTGRFVWLIDQLEEIFKLGLLDSVLDSLGGFLRELQVNGAWTLASIRSDALPQLKRHDALRTIFGVDEGQYYLASVRGLALDDVINLPARAADLTFGLAPDGRPVDQLLREEAYREPDSLPLLQFTLNELYLSRSGNELTYAEYQRLGGLAGSVATTAETILKAQATESPQTAARVFRSLVSVDETGRAVRRYAPIAEVDEDATQQRLLSQLVEARLCVTDQRVGEPVVAFAHDSLLLTLPALTDWLKEEGGLLQTRELAEHETRLWLENGRSDAWLAATDKVVSFKAVKAAGIPLTAEVGTFIERSSRRVRRAARIKQAAVGAIGVLALGASIAAWVAMRNEREASWQTAEARKAQLQLLTEAAAERLKDGDLSFARGIILEVLKRRRASEPPDPAAVNVLQEIRASDPQLAILTGHQGAVRDAAYSPDGRHILTGSYDRTARVWDAHTGILLRVFKGHTDVVRTAAYSPDGSQVLTAGLDGTARIWDAGTALEVRTLRVPKGVHSAAWSPGGERIVTTSDDGLRIWDARTGALSMQVTGRDDALLGSDFKPRAVFSPDGTRILAIAPDHTARVRDARSGRQLLVLSGHADGVRSAAYSPDGDRIVTCSVDTTARIWDAYSGAQLTVLSGHMGQCWRATYSPDGRTIATAAEDKTARIWDAATGRQLKILSGHVGLLAGAAYSPDSTRLVTFGWDETARTWDLRAGGSALVISGHRDQVKSVAYSPDGNRLLTASADGTARVWDAHSGALAAVLTGHTASVNSARYSPDGTRILTASDDGSIGIWDGRTGTRLRSIARPTPVGSAAYSPDGTRIVTFCASCADWTFAIYDARDGALIGNSPVANRDTLGSAVYSPDATRILTSSYDRTVRIHDAQTLAQAAVLRQPDQVNQAVYSPDGEFFATVSFEGIAHLWNARTQRELRVLAGHHADAVSVAFSPDGRRVVTGSSDQTVRIWDARGGTEVAVLLGHAGRVQSVAYSPDGAHVASGSADGTARIWDAATPAEWDAQETWERAVEADPLWNVQTTQLGLASALTSLASGALRASQNEARASSDETAARKCSRQAGAYYDPDRITPGLDYDRDRVTPGVEWASIVADTAIAACVPQAAGSNASAQLIYHAARAQLAGEEFEHARQNLEKAVSMGYRAARVDLALLLLNSKAKMYDSQRAASLLEQAWRSGVSVAAYELGALYEQGTPASDDSGSAIKADPESALLWYRAGSGQNEPRSLARLAERAENEAVDSSAGKADTLLLEAFALYARAAEHAQTLEWPDAVWKSWRYRRATLARILAADGLMEQVADAYSRVLDTRPQ